MIINHVGFDKIRQFSKRDKDYQLNPEVFKDFISYPPDEDGLLMAVEDRKNFPVNRKILVDVISAQYAKIEKSILQSKNIESLLSEDVFTVITAHQPSLFTGPFYYITKIVSAITLANDLSLKAGKKIIPIFINGSEDHDFDEINHLTIFGKKVVWENNEDGPVGRKTIEGLVQSFEAFKSILGQSDKAEHIINIFNDSIQNVNSYNEFVFQFLNRLFGHKGLIVVNTDDKSLKKLFIPVISKELLERRSQSIVQQAQNKLEAIGYKPQAFARDINLFYIEKGLRERIVFENGIYSVINTDLQWREDEILKLLDENPEKFSPNVVLRPVYQELIFPNIAYIGGGGELAYWQERKDLMKYFEVFMPVLLRRNSTMFFLKPQLKTIEKLGMEWQDFLNDLHQINQNYLLSISNIELELTMEKRQIIEVFNEIITKAINIDKGLKDGIEVERTKTIKQIEQIEARLVKSIKRNEETALNQIATVYHKIFPDGGLQERVDNFFQYHLVLGDNLLEDLYQHLNPLNKDVVVIIEEILMQD
ncbi:MAG TPA: bacillithiol biosynthesis cysteine-adding enzyme BshC [Saprospiraceae bacterium]|nr:bacillithiol biosynthesis cysteine-adding enzyme BshC [Saprospiraceae bacterium]